MRAFVTALLTFVGLMVAPFSGSAAAQPPPSYPLEFTGGTAGVSVEIFLNAGKVGDTTLNTTGSGDFILNLANSGKTRVEIYVDVCKDGKIIQVKFVTGNGQATPEDESCRRRIAAISFQSDCGVIRINFDLTNFGARVVGCGLTIRDPKVYGPLGGAVILIPILLSGGDSPTATATAPPAQTTTTTPPPTTTTPPQPPPTQQPPQQPTIEFTVTVANPSWNHPPGSNTSIVCTVVVTNPAQPGAQWTATVQGPFVAPGQTFSGTLNARGQAEIRATITNVGSYTFTVTVNSSGVSRSGTSNSVNVTFLNNTCATAQTVLAP